VLLLADSAQPMPFIRSTEYAKVIANGLWGLPPALDMDTEKRIHAQFGNRDEHLAESTTTSAMAASRRLGRNSFGSATWVPILRSSPTCVRIPTLS